MESPYNSPATPKNFLEPAMTPHHKRLMQVLLAVFILFLVVALYYGYRLVTGTLHTPVVSSAFEKKTVEFTDGGVPLWYKVSMSSLVPAANPAAPTGAPFTLLEEAPYANAAGDVAVLARVPNQEGTVLGILHKNGTLEPILTDGTYKTDLAVRSDGTALFASSTSTPAVVLALKATIPQADAIFADSHEDTASLMLVNIISKDHAVKYLGQGRSPRIEPDGSFLALTPRGLMVFNPGTNAPKLIIAHANADTVGAAISPDGSVVAIPNAQENTIFYLVRSAGVQTISVIGSQPIGPVNAAAFLDDQHFVTVSSSHTGTDAFVTTVLSTSTGATETVGSLRLPISSEAFPGLK
jgi:hypothetical protein